MSARRNPLTTRVTHEQEGSGVVAVADFEADPETGQVRLARLTFTASEGASVTATDLRAYQMAVATAQATRNLHGDGSSFVRAKVSKRPDGSDNWYRYFAGIYTFAAARNKKPAVLIADQSGVPVSTVHRWTREARRRGHLPPDPRGPKPR